MTHLSTNRDRHCFTSLGTRDLVLSLSGVTLQAKNRFKKSLLLPPGPRSSRTDRPKNRQTGFPDSSQKPEPETVKKPSFLESRVYA